MKRCTYFLVVAFVVGLFSLTLSAEAEALEDYFVKIPGMPGESKIKGYEDWIDALSFSVEIDRGLKGGKADSGTFVLLKYLDKATPQLGQYCTSGQRINEVRIDLKKAGKDGLNYMVYKLHNVTVASVRAEARDNKNTTEEVTFRFASITWTYTPQKADGTGDAAIEKSSKAPGKIPQRFVPRRY
ncbi:MAG: type VI secretion system tube protein Hcp [Deltaproteobacteria bacterium]|nr:type VI secretion system tube protein Hcp [Deltaproteobacteria bacterium]